MKNTLLLLTLLFLNAHIFGQSGNFSDPGAITVNTVYAIQDFEAPEGWIKILNDDASTLSGDIRTAVSTNNGGTIKPAGYVSGSLGFFGAQFNVSCNVNSLYIRGECINGKHLPIKKIELQGGEIYRYKKQPLSDYDSQANSYTNSRFENEKVKYWKEFKITWFVSNDPTLPHDQWVSVGESKNPLYVTHKKPIAGLDGDPGNEDGNNPFDPNDRPTELLLTSLHTACKYGADQTVEAKIVETIYSAFTNRCVKRVNTEADEMGECLGYWLTGDNSGDCWTVSEFLLHGNARCGEWADFFNDMIKLHGITSSKITSIKYTNNSAIPQDLETRMRLAIDLEFEDCFIGLATNDFSVLIVNKYNFSLDRVYVDEFTTEKILCNGKTVTKANIEGIPAQGNDNDNPISVFWNHSIVLHDGTYYDPSYGVSPKTSKVDYEDNAFAGFGVSPSILYYDPNGVMRSGLFLFLDERNTLGDEQTIINP